MSAETVCKLAGAGLLLGSFIVSSWILGHAAIAIDHALEDLAGFFHNGPTIFERYDSNPING